MASHSLDVLTRVSPAVPAALIARVEAWEPGSLPAEPRGSASVVLVRAVPQDTPTPRLETYLMHRHARMAFAASMAVFPGGGLEPADGSGPEAIRACAVRETLEETGVRLDPAELRPWAHWVTPEVEPRRYDTWFFLAVLPPGQVPEDLSGETEHAGWMSPADALAAAAGGGLGLMPPTLSILTELAEIGSLDALLVVASDRVVVSVVPRIEQVAGAWTFVYPEIDTADPDHRAPDDWGAAAGGAAR